MPTTSNLPDLDPLKAAQREAWSAGDYRPLGAKMLPAAELLCEAAGIRAGLRVLDVATGTGNAALAAARRGCNAVGVDFAPPQLEAARVRAAAEGLDAQFVEGDAEQLPFPDASFDAVLSVFGAMFAPDQHRVARELLRVCRPGGRIAMANWTPALAPFFEIVAAYAPPPAGIDSPLLWGTRERLEELFAGGASELRTECGRSPSTTLRRPRLQTSTARRSARSSPCSRDSTPTPPLRSGATSSGSGNCTRWAKRSRRRSSTSR